MISRFEYLYLESKVKKLEDILFTYEFEDKTYLAYQKWLRLDPEQKNRIIKEWNDYYKKCQDSEIGKLFQEARIALKAKQWDKVKELSNKAKEMEFVPITKPSSIDPYFFEHELSGYYLTKSKLKDLKNTVDEYKTVYGKKEASDSLI